MYMPKSVLIFILFILATGRIAGQSLPLIYDQPKEMLKLLKASKPDSSRVSILIMLGRSYLDKVEETKADRDTAFQFYSQAAQLSDQLHDRLLQQQCLKLKGKYYMESKVPEQATQSYMRVIRYFRTMRNQVAEGQAWYDYANDIPDLSAPGPGEKIKAYAAAAKIFSKLGDRLKVNGINKDIAEVHIHQGKFDLAEKELLQVIDVYKAINYRKLADTYFLLTILNSYRSDFKAALYYGLATTKSMVATNDTAFAFSYYTRLANVYNDLGMYHNSYLNYQLALSHMRPRYGYPYKIVQKMVLALVADNKPENALKILYVYIKKHPPADSFQNAEMYSALGACYQGLGDNQKEKEAYLQMVRYNEINFKLDPNLNSYIDYNRILCDFYVRTHDYHKAAAVMDKLQAVSKVTVSPLIRNQLKLLEFKIDSAFGKFIPAIKDFQSYKYLNDSMFNSAKARQVAELQIKYETEKKDQHLLMQSKNLLLQKKDIQLLVKQNQLVQLQVEKSKLRQNLIAGSALVLVLLLALGYRRYQANQQRNLELQDQRNKVTTKNTELEHLLAENNWLLKEVHHRVKNNLQIVMSLLNSQSAYLNDEIAINAVMESKMRVQAMSLIHQKLYGQDNASTIFMPDYIYDLIGYIKDSFKLSKNIYIDRQIAPLSLDVSQAVPVGLILNEAITNAFKYAFPHTASDTLTIKLVHEQPCRVLLIIADNGAGLPQDLNGRKTKSFGLKLITGLTEDLGGTFLIENLNGAQLTIEFELASLWQRREKELLPDLDHCS